MLATNGLCKDISKPYRAVIGKYVDIESTWRLGTCVLVQETQLEGLNYVASYVACIADHR